MGVGVRTKLNSVSLFPDYDRCSELKLLSIRLTLLVEGLVLVGSQSSCGYFNSLEEESHSIRTCQT